MRVTNALIAEAAGHKVHKGYEYRRENPRYEPGMLYIPRYLNSWYKEKQSSKKNQIVTRKIKVSKGKQWQHVPKYLDNKAMLNKILKRYQPNVNYHGVRQDYTAILTDGNNVYMFTAKTLAEAVFGTLIQRYQKDKWNWSV